MKGAHKKSRTEEEQKDEDEKHVREIQQHATEMKEMLDLIQECDIDNVIHAAKARRIGDMHIEKAKCIRSKLQGEVQKIKMLRNSCRRHGVKNLSAAIGEQQGNALLCIARDRDTEDGGKKGQLTSNPSDIDEVVGVHGRRSMMG